MADSLTITSTYAGELALPYVAPAILAADSIANNYVTLKENVKKNIVLKKLDGVTIQDGGTAGCDFDAQTGLTLTEAILTPEDKKVNIQLCKAQFRSDWEAMQTGRGYSNDQIPPNFQTFLLQFLSLKVAEAIERNIWQGNYDAEITGSAPYTDFDGLLKIVADGTSGFESLVAGAFTGDANAATGIITHLNTLVSGLPDPIQGDANTKIMMSRKSLFLLHQAMASIGVAGGYAPQVGADRPASYLGFDIVVPAGFPNDTLLGAQVPNLFFGTDLASDFNEVAVVDMTTTDASDNVRMAMKFSAGVQIAFLGDVAVVRRNS